MKQVQEPTQSNSQVKGQIQCIACRNLDGKTPKHQLRTGMGICKKEDYEKGEPFKLIELPRRCKDHDPAPELVAGRLDWLKNNPYVPTVAKEQTK